MQRERRGSQRLATRRQSGCAEPSPCHEQCRVPAKAGGEASTMRSPISQRTSIRDLDGNHHPSSEPVAVHVGRAHRVIRSEKLACPARQTASFGPVTTAQQAVPFSLVAQLANVLAHLPAADARVALTPVSLLTHAARIVCTDQPQTTSRILVNFYSSPQPGQPISGLAAFIVGVQRIRTRCHPLPFASPIRRRASISRGPPRRRWSRLDH